MLTCTPWLRLHTHFGIHFHMFIRTVQSPITLAKHITIPFILTPYSPSPPNAPPGSRSMSGARLPPLTTHEGELCAEHVSKGRVVR